MFRAEPVSLARVLVLEEHIPKFWEAVLDSACVHIEDRFQLGLKEVPPRYNLEEEKAKIEMLESRIDAICRLLSISSDELVKGDLYQFIEQISMVPSQISEAISHDLDRIEKNITEIVSLIEKRKQFIFDNNQLSWFVSLLMHAGLESLFELNPELLPYWVGSLPKENLQALFESLKQKPVVIETESISRNRVAIFLISLPEDKEAVEAALGAGGFLPAPVSSLDSTLSLTELEDDLEFAIWEAREEISELRAMLQKKKQVYKDLLSKLAKQLRLEKKLVMAMAACRGTQYVVSVDMWVRDRDRERVERQLNERLAGIIYTEWVKPENTPIAPEDIPASFNLGGVLNSFFGLLKGYGYPAFNEINPIVVFTIGFIFMYGIMFADIGHGLILFLLGLWLRKRHREFSDVFVWVGLSSAIWGWIFGSIFGCENIIKPLWIAPLHDPLPAMLFSLAWGVVYISLAIVFYIINALMNKANKEAWFGEWGIFSLLTYFGLLIAVVLKGLPMWVRLALIVMPLVVMVVGAIRTEKHADLAEILFRPVEIVLSLFANTVSFVRLAAFALNHAALMIVVFVIADLLKALPLKGIVLLFGNILVIVMEALLVMIQCLRLHYYEFFSKFYHGNGREFIPLRWET